MEQDNIPAPSIRVGCTTTGRRRDVYLERFNVLEYSQSFIFPPKPAVLTKLRSQAPEGFAFYVRAWQLITHEADSPTYARIPHEIKGDPQGFGSFKESPEVENAWRNTVRAARRLNAKGVVFTTPAAFTPTAQNRKNMARFFAMALEEEGDNLQLIWEPAGLWSSGEVQALADELGVLPCWDPLSREELPRGERAYLRISNLGRPVDPTLSELSWLAEGLAMYREAVCILDTRSMFADGQRLQEHLGR